MTPERKPTNVAASVRARLLNLARERAEEFQHVLSDYATERLLYRLGISSHAERFVLKGAMLLRLWSPQRHRATWDLDLLGRGTGSVDGAVAAVRDLCGIVDDDGIIFDLNSLAGSEIRAQDEYAGARVRLNADLAGARIPMLENYPTLLDHAHPRILAYPREAVIAEKLEAMVTLGVTNSRMKDFYDVHLLASSFAFVIRTPIIPPYRTLIFPPLRLNRQGGDHGACREIV